MSIYHHEELSRPIGKFRLYMFQISVKDKRLSINYIDSPINKHMKYPIYVVLLSKAKVTTNKLIAKEGYY